MVQPLSDMIPMENPPESMMTPIRWQGTHLEVLDQRKLPIEEVWVSCSTVDHVADAIKLMLVRGAPAIGVTAAFGLALYIRDIWRKEDGIGLASVQVAANKLLATRPTAVNLRWATWQMTSYVERYSGTSLDTDIVEFALFLWRQDIWRCRSIGLNGHTLIKPGSTILTHCNAGALACGGYGTSLGIIRAADEWKKQPKVYACETRPYGQGARITAYELVKENIPVTVIVDSAAHDLMRRGKIDAVIVGADRITANGDVVNKIGTLGLALTANRFKIPFIVAAPTSTYDRATLTGDDVIIEDRPAYEIRGTVDIPAGADVFNPSFDVTPAEFVCHYVTENGTYPTVRFDQSSGGVL